MAMKQANAAQKQWMNDITEWAENNIQILYGNEWLNKPIQRHHVLGRSAKHNKVAIGHWFILPVPFELHDVSSNHEHNVTHRKNSFIREFGNQRGLFEKMCLSMKDYNYNMPSLKEYISIMSTSA
jgi:hypothetical protein